MRISFEGADASVAAGVGGVAGGAGVPVVGDSGLVSVFCGCAGGGGGGGEKKYWDPIKTISASTTARSVLLSMSIVIVPGRSRQDGRDGI